MADRLGVTWCGGGCGLSVTKHQEGAAFLGVIHFAERRFSRRTARNFLMLVAMNDRKSDAGYLNVELFDWWYVYHDSITAMGMAQQLGFRLPAALFDQQRRQCRDLAAKRGVRLSRYRKVYEWATR